MPGGNPSAWPAPTVGAIDEALTLDHQEGAWAASVSLTRAEARAAAAACRALLKDGPWDEIETHRLHGAAAKLQAGGAS